LNWPKTYFGPVNLWTVIPLYRLDLTFDNYDAIMAEHKLRKVYYEH